MNEIILKNGCEFFFAMVESLKPLKLRDCSKEMMMMMMINI